MSIIIVSRSNSKLGHGGPNTRSLGQILKIILYTLEGTVFIQRSGNFVGIFILMISRLSSKLGHVRSKTRSIGQILENLCVHSRRHSFDPKACYVRKLIILISRSISKLGHVGSKTRSLGQILEIKLMYTLEDTVLI